MPERLYHELSAKAPGVYIELIPDAQREQGAWVGGSMFASLEAFAAAAVKKADYDDSNDPATLIHRKYM